ncbi:MAG: hypothetical protein HY996_02950 [Micrococcales bacterium]|nr:hypothetical protein [Micrococcales bacterium]
MTRRLTVLFSLFEAVLVAGIGIAIPLVPLTVIWAAQYGFAPDWMIFWRASVDVWLVGHGVDLTLLPNATIQALVGSAEPVRITMAALGFALLTLLLGARAGARIAETGHRILGLCTTTLAFGALSAGLAFTALLPAARPSFWQGAFLPTGVYLLGLLVSVLVSEPELGPDAGLSPARVLAARWSPRLRALVATSLRAGLGAAAITVLVSAVTVAVLVVSNYAQLIRLYESLHADVAGSVAVTAAQLAILPNLVLWAASWFVGPGFALGVGSSISPLGTVAGPLPAIPLLGAIPQGQFAFAFAGLIVPVVAGFLAGVGARRGLREASADGHPGAWMFAAAGAGGVIGGGTLALLSWASAGSAGPGRFVQLGPDPIAVGLSAALELAVAIGIGLAVGGGGAGIGRRLPWARMRMAEPESALRHPADRGAASRAEHDSTATAELETVPPRRD